MRIFLARSVKANRGDLASQAGIVRALLADSRLGDVIVSTHYPHHFVGSPVRTLEPPGGRGFFTTRAEGRVLRGGAPVLWGGGVDLQDLGSKMKMPLVLTRLALLKRHGAPVVLACQGVGPITSAFGHRVLRRIARLVDVALVREPTAVDLLRGAGFQGRLHQAHDAALLLESPDPAFGRQYLRQKGLDPDAPTLCVNLRRWFHQSGSLLPAHLVSTSNARDNNEPTKRLVENVASVVSNGIEWGYQQVALLPMYRREPEPWENDIALLRSMAKQVRRAARFVMIDEDLSPAQLSSVIANTDLMIGVRLHATILAHLAGVPAVHIAYDHKGFEHFHSMGLDQLAVPIEECVGPAGSDVLESVVYAAHGALNTLRPRVLKMRTTLATRTMAALRLAVGDVLDVES